MPITLTITRGPEVGRRFTFDGPGTFLIGRSERAQLMLPEDDPRVSQTHCLVECGPLGCRVYDLKSRNGTYVNGKRVTAGELEHGAEIRVGRTVFRLELGGDSPPETVDWAPGPAASETPPVRRPPTAHSPPPSAGRSAKPREPLRTARPEATCPACRKRLGPVRGEPVCASCLDAIAEQEQPFPGYRVICEKGRGGMGLVFLAWSDVGNRPVALKVIHPAMALKEAQARRFVRETETLRNLDHPNIVGFRDAGHADGRLYLAMEFVHGKSAAAGLLTIPQFHEPVAVTLTCEVLRALEYAHAKKEGYVHRDVKPANVLLHMTPAGTLGAKLADFGLVKVYQASQVSRVTDTGEVGGTVGYMPPEQVTNYRDAGHPADQYSAAATLYTLLTGYTVYDLPPHVPQQLNQLLTEDPVPILDRNPDLSPDLAEAVMTALSRDPADRFPDVRAFRKAIQRFGG